ncbi:DNA-directed RNA polymerase subunit alpha C-terminal domain-containing protein [Chloroflexota bacterium]
MKLNGNYESKLRTVLSKAKRIPLSSISEESHNKYLLMGEMLSSLGEGEAIEIHAPDLKMADTLRSQWTQIAASRHPHSHKIRQDDSSYLLYLWIGGDRAKAVTTSRLDNTTEEKLLQALVKVKIVSMASIPDITPNKYELMKKLLESLRDNEALQLSVNDSKEVDRVRAGWSQLATGRYPHTHRIKQTDGSYLLYLWLGGMVIDEVLKLKPSKQKRQATQLIVDARPLGITEISDTTRPPHPTEETSIVLLGLNTRSYRTLENAGIKTIHQLLKLSRADLIKLRNLGTYSIEHIANRLKTYIETPSTSDSHDTVVVEKKESICEAIRTFEGICSNFENQEICEDFPLPSKVQDNLSKWFDIRVETLADICKLIMSGSLSNVEISLLQPTVHWLTRVQTYKCLDEELNALVHNLDDRELFVLVHRFGIDSTLTLKEIGDRYGITRERVRQIQSKLQRKLISRTRGEPLLYSQAAILVLRRLGENTSLELWQKRLEHFGILKKGALLSLFVAIARSSAIPKLSLPEKLLQHHIQPSKLLG